MHGVEGLDREAEAPQHAGHGSYVGSKVDEFYAIVVVCDGVGIDVVLKNGAVAVVGIDDGTEEVGSRPGDTTR